MKTKPPSPRIAAKSKFLQDIERAQHVTEYDADDLRVIGSDLPPPQPRNVVILDQSRRRRR